MSNKQKYQQRAQRIMDAVALKETDQIPVMPNIQAYPYFQAGYTMADIMYDTDLSKSTKSLLKFLDDYEPDSIFGHTSANLGQGPILELAKPKTLRWAGMPGKVIPDDSIHQFIEFSVLEDEEYDMFFTDRFKWMLQRGIPRTSGLLEPLAKFDPASIGIFSSHAAAAATFSTPEFKEMIQTLWKINDMSNDLNARIAKLDQDLEAYGYPILATGMAMVPFDDYSDFYRGTINSCSDMYENPEQVMAYCEEKLEQTLQSIKFQGMMMPGKMIFMPLHKGMETFMNHEHYRKFYWKHLQTIIHAIIDAGMTPLIYTEGKYDNRLECLKEVPKGKVIYFFEECDMARAKKVLGDTACIGGGYPLYLLSYGTKEQVIDATKRHIDTCAPGGGFIFTLSAGWDYAKPENIDAMFDTVRTYGKK